MNQKCFEFMFEQSLEEICVGEKEKKALMYQMASALIEVEKEEREKTDDKL